MQLSSDRTGLDDAGNRQQESEANQVLLFRKLEIGRSLRGAGPHPSDPSFTNKKHLHQLCQRYVEYECDQ